MEISIVISTFNGAKYIEDCLDSILNQTYDDYEVIITDDNSSDNTYDIIKKYAQIDNRIKIYRNIRHNHSLALNMGIEMSKGKYIARIDQDDIMLPNRLEFQTNFMDKNPDFVVCSSWFETFGSFNSIYNEKKGEIQDIITLMLLGNPIANPTAMIRKSFIDNYKIRYDERFYYAEDYKFWFEIAKLGGNFYVLPEILQKYRIHAEQATNKNHEKQEEEGLCVKCDVINHIIDTGQIPDMTLYTIIRLLEIYNAKKLVSYNTVFELVYEILTNYKCTN